MHEALSEIFYVFSFVSCSLWITTFEGCICVILFKCVCICAYACAYAFVCVSACVCVCVCVSLQSSYIAGLIE